MQTYLITVRCTRECCEDIHHTYVAIASCAGAACCFVMRDLIVEGEIINVVEVLAGIGQYVYGCEGNN